MEEARTKDIIRYTMHSYVGKTIKTIQLDPDQKKAIGILLKFSEDKFELICLDIINEIRRRNGLDYDKPSVLGDKLANMDEKKFRNLVIESLVVFYIKNTQFKIEEMPEMLDNIKKLIDEMKNQIEIEVFTSQMKNLSFYDKIYEFIEFSKKKGIDETCANYMKESVDREIENSSLDFINSLAYTELFINSVKKSNLFQEKIVNSKETVEKLENINSNVKKAIEFKDGNLSDREDALRKNTNEIFNILANNLSFPSKNIEYYEEELKGITSILEGIEMEIKNNTKINLEEASVDLVKIMSKIIEKGTNLSEKRIVELKIQQISAEMMNSSLSRKDSFMLVLDIAKDIRKSLASV